MSVGPLGSRRAGRREPEIPYTNQPRTNPRDAVRLLVGDISTSTGREYLSDVDYDFFLSATPNQYSAGALAANSLAMRFAGDGTEKSVGDLRIKRAQAAEYRDLSKQLARMSALQSAPYAGGISRSDKASVEADSDRVKPAFAAGQFDNPQAIDPTEASTST